MICFDIIKNVLNSLWENLDGTDEEKGAKIKAAQDNLRKNYLRIENSEIINYDDPATQFAYIFTYTSAHGDFLYQLLNKISHIHDFDFEKEFRIMSLGGGPGSDLIGCLKYFDTLENAKLRIQSNSFDMNSGWSFCWSDVASCIPQRDDDNRMYQQLTSVCHTLDITDQNASKKIKKFLNSDIITMIYFMSEVLKSKGNAENFFDFLFSNVSGNTVIAFVDNKMDNVSDWFDGLTEKHGYEVLATSEDRIVASHNEQADVLERYQKLTGLRPKVQAHVRTRAVRKKK